MEILTIKELKKILPNTIFGYGVGMIEHPWFNDATPISEGGTLEPDGKSTKVKWVAVRGGIYDWAIYHSLDANFMISDYLNDPNHLEVESDRIAQLGTKLCKEEDIKKFVPCDDEAFGLYRF